MTQTRKSVPISKPRCQLYVSQPRSQLRKCQYHSGINRRLPVGASNELGFLRLQKNPESLPSQGKLTFLQHINKHQESLVVGGRPFIKRNTQQILLVPFIQKRPEIGSNAIAIGYPYFLPKKSRSFSRVVKIL